MKMGPELRILPESAPSCAGKGLSRNRVGFLPLPLRVNVHLAATRPQPGTKFFRVLTNLFFGQPDSVG